MGFIMKNTSQEKDLDKIFTIPNILSTIRILLIPVFLWLYLVEKNYLMATIIIFISGFTDVVDGFIARKFNLISKVGKVLDPTADKLTQAAVLLALMVRFDHMIIAFIVLAFKETVMLTLGIVLYNQSKQITGSKWHGKIAAMVVYAMLVTHLIWGIKSEMPLNLSYITVGAAIGAMIISLILYIKDYLILLKQNKDFDEKELNF